MAGQVITNHCIAKHWVDDVNNRRHAPIGLEDIWATKWWQHQQFTFMCSVAEVMQTTHWLVQWVFPLFIILCLGNSWQRK
jgi:hypothetical protein